MPPFDGAGGATSRRLPGTASRASLPCSADWPPARESSRFRLRLGDRSIGRVDPRLRLRQERRGGCMQASDRRATRAIAVSFGVLAAYVGVEALRDLAVGHEPDASTVGIVMATLSLAVMPTLARAKRRLAPVIGSSAVVADANQTSLCALLRGAVGRVSPSPRSRPPRQRAPGGPTRSKTPAALDRAAA